MRRTGQLPVPTCLVGTRHMIRLSELDAWLTGSSSQPVADMVAVLARLVAVLEKLERGVRYLAIEKDLQGE